jgi:hypothetical protein
VLRSRAGSGLIHKLQTRLKKLAKDKRSSLLQKFVTVVKSFITLAPGPSVTKLFTTAVNKCFVIS